MPPYIVQYLVNKRRKRTLAKQYMIFQGFFNTIATMLYVKLIKHSKMPTVRPKNWVSIFVRQANNNFNCRNIPVKLAFSFT